MGFLFSPHYQAVNASGNPLSGAKLYFYEVGTTNEITTYQEAALTTPHANPVIADSAGLFAPIYLNTSPFKTQLDTSADVAVQTVQVIYGGIDSGRVVGNDVATATTIALDAEGPSFDLTGTTTVSTVTLGEGKQRRARATGSFQLTASANLVVNGNASVNLAVSSGDMLFLWGFASSIVYVWGVSIVAASETVSGVSERATNAETQTGTDTSRHITPANLTSKEASVSNWRENISNRILTTDIVWASAAEVTLTDAATIAVDGDTFLNATVTLAGNRTLGAWANAKPGQSGRIRVVQDATGSRTLSYHADYEFAEGTAPTLSTAANAEDLLYYEVIASGRILIASVLDIS